MLKAIVLGLVQGLTEFLPVSSSGHLVIIPYLLSWEQPSLAMGVALHAGTLLAVIVYFAGDLWYLATRSVGVATTEDGEVSRARRTVGLLALGSVPAAAAGFLLEGFFASTFEEPRLATGFLLVTAALLYVAERVRRRRAAAMLGVADERMSWQQQTIDPGRDETTIGWLDSAVIGAAQALAIFPGISRSGSTIAAGMLRGLSRSAAARFSFLLSIPIILGATLLSITDMIDASNVTGGYTGLETVVGAAVAAGSGYWAISYLLKLVHTDDLTGFARYVVFFAILAFVGTLWLGPPSSV